jgi:hypothetical protein
MTGNRATFTKSMLDEIVRRIIPLLSEFDPATIHQVAVQIVKLPRPIKLGKSEGDCLIFAVDIRKMVIPTAFVRYQRQGKPKMAQAYIDLDGQKL